MTAHDRHIRAYRFFKWLMPPILRQKFGFTYTLSAPVGEPHIVIANHCTDWDPIFLSIALPEHMYYVASEHIFRKGVLSSLLVRYIAPISRLKGGADVSTVKKVLMTIKNGDSVGIFAEGNRCFNGVTGEIPVSIGKLIRAARVPLVTFRFTGGYFTSPRWSKYLRRGSMHGQVVKVYSKEALQEMSLEQINQIVAADLYEDAYAAQAKHPIAYKGRALAEHLETALYLCPRCGGLGTLKSREDRFYCDCGLTLTLTAQGYFAGTDVPYQTVTQWDAWQTEALRRVCAALGSKPAFIDQQQTLYQVDGNSHKSRLVTVDAAAAYRDRLEVGTTSFSYAQITDMSIYGAMTLTFSTGDGAHYELVSPYPRSARKYLALYQFNKE